MGLPSGGLDLDGNATEEEIAQAQARLVEQHAAEIADFEQREAAHLVSVEAFDASTRAMLKSKADLADKAAKRRAAALTTAASAADKPTRRRSRSASERRGRERPGTAAAATAVKKEVEQVDSDSA